MKSAICAIVKNEPDIFEWTLYHSLIGFDTIIVFNNGSTDGTLDELAMAGRFADVRIIDWPLHPGQHQAYNHALERFGPDLDWMAFVDADEFIVPIVDHGIRPFLERMEGQTHIALSWVIYGTGGQIDRPASLVTEGFLWRSHLDFTPNQHIKTLVRSREVSRKKLSRFVNPHFMENATYVTPNRAEPEWIYPGKIAQPSGTEIVRINHYYTRSKWHFAEKLKRGRATVSSERVNNFDRFDQNAVSDPIVCELYASELEQIKSCRREILAEREKMKRLWARA